MMDKHNVVIIVLIIFLVSSLSFSFYLMVSQESSQISQQVVLEGTLENTEKLKQEKSSLEIKNKELERELEETRLKVPIFEVEKDSPFDHLKESQFKVLKSKVEINVQDVSWWTIEDTNSMDPLIDIGSTVLSIQPKTQNDIYVGDVAFYQSLIVKKSIVHRVIKIDNDDIGWYSKFKGDNLKKADPEDVRFPQIEGVLIGIIY